MFCQVWVNADLRDLSCLIQYRYMTTATLEIYNILLSAGVEQDKAEYLASEILTKTEAKETLATKADIYKLALGQSALIIGAMGVLLSIMR